MDCLEYEGGCHIPGEYDLYEEVYLNVDALILIPGLTCTEDVAFISFASMEVMIHRKITFLEDQKFGWNLLLMVSVLKSGK